MNIEVTDPHHGGKIGVTIGVCQDGLAAKLGEDLYLDRAKNKFFFILQYNDGMSDRAEDVVKLSPTDAHKLYLTLGTMLGLDNPS
jgi:hypothetical protein